MVFDAFRVNKAPTLYGENKTPWQGDVVEGGLAFCAVILFLSFLVILPGIRGKEKIYSLVRVIFMIFVGTSILVCLFAQSWEAATISNVKTQYKAGIKGLVHADVGLYIGLRGINITLKSNDENFTTIYNETINYNEHFSWEWRQGRLGFGPFAGTFNREFRFAQRRGIPYPILWVAEYFTVDGEGIRWGRHYRLAGWYSHVVLWLAFALLMVTLVMTYVLIRYATYTLAMCGTSILFSNILFVSIRNPNDLKIPFPGKFLEPVQSWTFFLCLFTGLLTVVVAIVLFLFDWLRHDLIVNFFGIDALQDADDEVKVVEEDVVSNEGASKHTDVGGRKVNSANGDTRIESDDDDDDVVPTEEALPPPPPPEPPRYRPRENRVTKIFKQQKRRSGAPPPRPRRHVEAHEQTVQTEDEGEDYENAEVLKSGQVNLEMKPRQRHH